MLLSNLSQKFSFTIISALVILALIVVIMSLSMVTMRETPEALAEAWKDHREACLQLPDEMFHYDRSRAVQGLVLGPDGKPVSGAFVQCVRLPALLELSQSSPLTPELWSDLVETETRTDLDGRYEFSHLSEGCRTICVSASGLAPDVQSLVVTLDGSGARVDFKLEAARTLRIRLEEADDRPRCIQLVPYRWWPELVSRDVAPGETEVALSGIGGPFRKGLVFVSDSTSGSSWKPRAAYDLDRSDDITVSSAADYIASPQDVPEAKCIFTWQPNVSEADRLFYSMLTPVALFWQTGSSLPSAAAEPEGRGPNTPLGSSGLHGYGPNAFLPILIESHDGRAWLKWTSGASEFELLDTPAGLYRVRSLDMFGKVSFARGLIVLPAEAAELGSRPVDQIRLDEPLSREVMGTVQWEDGSPVEGAEVFLQDAIDFRRFLQRVVTDRNGFFWISNVPAAQYVAFALPPKDEHAMKSFVYPRLDEAHRETWLDFSLSPHRIVGQLPKIGSAKRIELVRQDPEGRERIVWSVTPSESGQFVITNVPHGRYVVHAVGEGSAASITSLTFDVESDTYNAVPWPK